MNEKVITDELYHDVIDYIAEELYSSWHPEKPDDCQLALNPGYEHDKMLEHCGKYSAAVDVLNIISGIMIPDIEADAWSLARRYEKDRQVV